MRKTFLTICISIFFIEFTFCQSDSLKLNNCNKVTIFYSNGILNGPAIPKTVLEEENFLIREANKFRPWLLNADKEAFKKKLNRTDKDSLIRMINSAMDSKDTNNCYCYPHMIVLIKYKKKIVKFYLSNIYNQELFDTKSNGYKRQEKIYRFLIIRCPSKDVINIYNKKMEKLKKE